MSLLCAVTGATGTQGGAVARALLARGVRVRAVTRQPEGAAARALTALGAEAVRADMNDAESLAHAFEGADAVYAVTDFFKNGIDGEIRHGKAMADAARAGGVRHLVVASVASADRAASVPHFASKREIERHVERVGIAATIVRPSIFMEDLTEKKYVPPASWGMMRKIIGTDRPIPWISARDIGEAVAAIVTARDTWRDRTVTLAGDVRSIGEARAIFERVNGKRPFALAIPNAIFRAFVSRELLAMWEWLARETMDGSVEQTRALVPGALGMEQWLRARSEPRAAQRAAR